METEQGRIGLLFGLPGTHRNWSTCESSNTYTKNRIGLQKQIRQHSSSAKTENPPGVYKGAQQMHYQFAEVKARSFFSFIGQHAPAATLPGAHDQLLNASLPTW